jgi:ATP-binding cassette, subfamily A (ABC1), member 3
VGKAAATLAPFRCQGLVRCAGSPSFLKRLFGVGYILTCVRKQGADSQKIAGSVQRLVPGCAIASDVGSELSFRMPLESASQLPSLFAMIDANAALGVESYALSITNLESVFLRIAREDESVVTANAIKVAAASSASRWRAPESPPTVLPEAAIDVDDAASSQPLTIAEMRARALKHQGSSFGHFVEHCKALMQKRLRLAGRDRIGCIFQFLIPVVILLIGMLVLRTTCKSWTSVDV